MRIPRSYVEAYSSSLNTLCETARRELESRLAEVDWSLDVTEIREQVAAIMESCCGASATMAARLAADFYDGLRAQFGIADEYKAVVSAQYDPKATEGAVRAFAQDLVDGKPVETFVGKCTDRLDREVRLSANRCVERNARRDPKRPRWARVPTGPETCEFCIMLASRGFVYHSEELASHAHAHCDCRVVPSWDKAKAEVEGYDPDYYRDMWQHPERYEKPEAAEQQFVKPRNSARNHYSVDYDAVNSGTFTKAFDSLPYGHKARRGLRTESGKILREHDGTAKETLTAIDAKTGRPVADTRDHAAIDSAAYFSDEAKRKVVQNPNPVILLHNHPGSSMPSGADCVSVCTNPKAVGSVVVCHDGGVYNITPLRFDGIESAYNEFYEIGRMSGMSKPDAEAYASGKLIDANEEERWFEITFLPPKNSKS